MSWTVSGSQTRGHRHSAAPAFKVILWEILNLLFKIFPFFPPRLQNVLEDFRDIDATALEETKATVRHASPYSAIE